MQRLSERRKEKGDRMAKSQSISPWTGKTIRCTNGDFEGRLKDNDIVRIESDNHDNDYYLASLSTMWQSNACGCVI